MANINPKDIEKRAKECEDIVFGNNKEPFRYYSRREIRDYIVNGKPFNNNVMEYKPIEYKDFEYEGKAKKVEPKIEDIKINSIKFVVPKYETTIKDNKIVVKYHTDSGIFMDPRKVFSLIPNLDWKSDENK